MDRIEYAAQIARGLSDEEPSGALAATTVASILFELRRMARESPLTEAELDGFINAFIETHRLVWCELNEGTNVLRQLSP